MPGCGIFTIIRSGGVEISPTGEEVDVTESEVPELPEPGAKGRCSAARAERSGNGVLRGHRRQGPQDRGARAVPEAREREAGQDPEARRQGDQPRSGGVQGAEPPAGGPLRPGGDHFALAWAGDPGRGRRYGSVRG